MIMKILTIFDGRANNGEGTRKLKVVRKTLRLESVSQHNNFQSKYFDVPF